MQELLIDFFLYALLTALVITAVRMRLHVGKLMYAPKSLADPVPHPLQVLTKRWQWTIVAALVVPAATLVIGSGTPVCMMLAIAATIIVLVTD